MKDALRTPVPVITPMNPGETGFPAHKSPFSKLLKKKSIKL
jgi:hypothetical protein